MDFEKLRTILNHPYYVKKSVQIKEKVKSNIYPPIFNVEIWKKLKANCYSYALDIAVNDSRKIMYSPGYIQNENTEKLIFNSEDLMEAVKKDLGFLGFSYRENDNEQLYIGEYRIAIYSRVIFPYDAPLDWHFSRQDIDGRWSEKRNYQSLPEQFPEKTVNPPDLSKYGFVLEGVLIIYKN